MPINQKDGHVLALAVHLEARFVISHNLRDFADVVCEPFGVRALAPDDFLAVLDSNDLRDAVGVMSQRRRRPPISAAELQCVASFGAVSNVDGEFEVLDYGVGGAGPDGLIMPDDIEAGLWRLCTANALNDVCVRLTVEQ